VLHHHEHFNGAGYPHGLRGNEIPIGARIVAVADAYHAMVHERPYSVARSHAEALAELRRTAGTQFDPDVVEVFCSIYAEAVPSDGLEEVYRLHERARDGLPHIEATHSHAHPHPQRPDDAEAEAEVPAVAAVAAGGGRRRPRKRAARAREASG
jgi:hypothetical protein